MELIKELNNFYSYKILITHLRTIILLIICLLNTILLEILVNSFIEISPEITLLEHMQSSFILKILIYIILIESIVFLLLILLLTMISIDGILIIYMTFLKFIQLISPLIDLINLLFIYQYKIKHSIYPSNRLCLSLIFALIRLIINLNIIRQKCDSKLKRQIIIIIDLLLFILINISLIRYSNKKTISTVRTIILSLVIFQLNNLFYNKTFWIDLINRNEYIKQQFSLTIPLKFIHFILNNLKINMKFQYLKIIHLILSIRWFVSSFIVGLFAFYIFQSIINDNLFSIQHFLKSHGLILIICIIILYLINWDTLQNRNTLDQHGISRFCIGIDILSRIKSSEVDSINRTTTGAENEHMNKLQQTCLVCYNDKDIEEFYLDFPSNCHHLNRSICNSCLFHHVKKTFTDVVYCPEIKCGIKFDYETVKTILFLNGNDKLVEKYDRYIFYRELEKMDEFIWCSNSLCNVGQLNEGGKLNNIVTCFNCKQKTCFTHKIKWHNGLTCEEYSEKIDPNYESSRKWIVKNSKKCPNCPYQIEKNHGCDHMTCIKCHYEFCWSCLADCQSIRQYGNHRHNPNCKHYVPYKRK